MNISVPVDLDYSEEEREKAGKYLILGNLFVFSGYFYPGTELQRGVLVCFGAFLMLYGYLSKKYGWRDKISRFKFKEIQEAKTLDIMDLLLIIPVILIGVIILTMLDGFRIGQTAEEVMEETV